MIPDQQSNGLFEMIKMIGVVDMFLKCYFMEDVCLTISSGNQI